MQLNETVVSGLTSLQLSAKVGCLRFSPVKFTLFML